MTPHSLTTLLPREDSYSRSEAHLRRQLRQKIEELLSEYPLAAGGCYGPDPCTAETRPVARRPLIQSSSSGANTSSSSSSSSSHRSSSRIPSPLSGTAVQASTLRHRTHRSVSCHLRSTTRAGAPTATIMAILPVIPTPCGVRPSRRKCCRPQPPLACH